MSSRVQITRIKSIDCVDGSLFSLTSDATQIREEICDFHPRFVVFNDSSEKVEIPLHNVSRITWETVDVDRTKSLGG